MLFAYYWTIAAANAVELVESARVNKAKSGTKMGEEFLKNGGKDITKIDMQKSKFT